jgi:hypothetical protein
LIPGVVIICPDTYHYQTYIHTKYTSYTNHIITYHYTYHYTYHIHIHIINFHYIYIHSIVNIYIWLFCQYIYIAIYIYNIASINIYISTRHCLKNRYWYSNTRWIWVPYMRIAAVRHRTVHGEDSALAGDRENSGKVRWHRGYLLILMGFKIYMVDIY